MALVYFDSTALVKLLVDEPDSDLVADLWNGCDVALSSRLAYPEVCASLAAAGRNHDLTEGEVRSALELWDEFWISVWPVELSVKVESVAGAMASSRQLRGADAAHLASAMVMEDPDLVFAVWDRRLHGAAVRAGLSVAPSTLR